jgi:hypothetical protein
VIPKSIVAVALLLMAAGCGGHAAASVLVDSPSSPLGSGGPGHSEQCGPDASGGVMTDGTIVLDNHSKRSVVIEHVRYYGDHHLRFLRAVILPVRGSLIGVAYGWPPPAVNLRDAETRWSQSVPVVGATIPPARQSEELDLLIEFRPTAYRSSADGLQIFYRQGRSQYEYRTHLKTVIFIAKSAGKC